jgi:hypothetical protein
VRAALTLTQSWISQGRPAFTERTLGSFEQWSATIGGILEVSGVKGFLGNVEEFSIQSAEDESQWESALKILRRKAGDQSMTVAVINTILESGRALVDVRGSGNFRSQVTRLGKALYANRDRIYGKLKIVLESDNGHHGRLYQLQRVK